MPITSFTFVLFVLIIAGVYYLLPRRTQNFWLLITSYIFHVTWTLQFALILLVSTVVNYWLGSRLQAGGYKRQRILFAGISFNIAVLIIFKAGNFFVPELVDMLQRMDIKLHGESIKILIPIGLSYYVLQNISYLLDVYRGQMNASQNFINFSLYLAYFPKLLAGPIERARSFLPKLEKERVVDNEVLTRSITLIVVGLARKIIIADTLTATIPWDVFTAPSTFCALELWLWLFVYAFSIYNDFAGYTSIVRGVSGLFGIELSPNFNFPFFSRTFSEFWNRWHITLSHWLRDYIYYPLSRSLLRRFPVRNHPINLIVPPMITMLTSGFWHGFSWQMVFWGCMHGLYLVAERITILLRPGSTVSQQPVWRQFVSIVTIFILVSIAWVPFRTELPVALHYWLGLLNWTGFVLRYNRVVLIVPFLAVIIGLDWLQYRHKGELTFLSWPRLSQAVMIAGILFLVFILSQSEKGEPFIYQGF